jgi:hypothetical protein
MQLFIPTLGQRLKLTKDWKFTLHDERRNSSLKQLIEYSQSKFEVEDSIFDILTDDTKKKEDKIQCVLPVGTILTVRRIYIRQGAKSYDSVTFSIHSCPDKIKGRFWVKLYDANTIECELVEEVGKNIEVKIPFSKPYSFYIDTDNDDAVEYAAKLQEYLDGKKIIFRENISVNKEIKYQATCYVRSVQNRFASYRHQRWYIPIESLKFEILDLETNEIIGNWGTFDTIKKNIKKREVEKQKLQTA